MRDPIDHIEWLEADALSANNYNPNVVYTPELRLLEYSLLHNGWIHPILVSTELVIIDGFHRWRLAQDSRELCAKYGARVPCAVLELSEIEAMLMTVRINRAKGSHVAARVSHMVRNLIDDHNVPREYIAKGIGAQLAEIDLLYQKDVFASKDIKGAKYSKAWIPIETNAPNKIVRNETGPGMREDPSSWEIPSYKTHSCDEEYWIEECSWDDIAHLEKVCRREGVPLHDSQKTTWVRARVGNDTVALIGMIMWDNGRARVRAGFTDPNYRRLGLSTEVRQALLALGLARGVKEFESFSTYPQIMEQFGFEQIGVKNSVAHMRWVVEKPIEPVMS